MIASARTIRPSSPTFASDEERWTAVLQRDPRADGVFWYSVRTTGIYCRPTCPARRAQREHVRFHETGAAAAREGFRPCRRCSPGGPGLLERRAAAVARACRLIDTTGDDLPGVERLAREAGMSRYHFQRTFKAVTGVTPRAYAAARRGERVRQALPRRTTVTEAAFEAGFNSTGRFYAASTGLLGMKPRQFKSGGDGLAIKQAAAKCSLGYALVAATSKGICAILLGDDVQRLERELRARFPNATIDAGDAAFDRLVATVVAFVESPDRGWRLPLDVRGTAFQQRVWEALRRVPPGSTTSYSELARRIGSPSAVRAVAQACAANPVAVAIPCHRVLRSDGSLSGYRWGVARKRALLQREAGRTADLAVGRKPR